MKKEMPHFQTQRADKPTIEAMAKQQLEGNLLKDFKDFLDFLQEETITLPWTSINAFNANYKGKRVGKIYLGGNSLAKNSVEISVITAEWDKLDDYLKAQSDEFVSLFINYISDNKCRRCRPDCSCARDPEYEFKVLGQRYEYPCFAFGRHTYRFVSSGGGMSDMLMLGVDVGEGGAPGRMVSIETVKKLMLARKEFIARMLI